MYKSTSIFDGWIYEHEQYRIVFETLVEEIERALHGATPFVFPLLGDSRAGKSALLKDIEAHFGSRVSPSGHQQIISVAMPTVASNEALAVRIIKCILGDITVKGKTYQILDQARQTMQAAGLRVLLIDETNHLVERRSSEKAQTKDNRQTADWFKELGDESKISVVVSGLSHVCRMYTDNDQLENRGLVGARIYPYAWSVQKDREQFQNTVLAGITHLQENGWRLEVPPDVLIRLSYLGGGGYIGKARDFLVRVEEVGNRLKRIDSKLLSRAYKDKYRLDSHGDSVEFKAIDDLMLNRAHQTALARASSNGRGQ